MRLDKERVLYDDGLVKPFILTSKFYELWTIFSDRPCYFYILDLNRPQLPRIYSIRKKYTFLSLSIMYRSKTHNNLVNLRWSSKIHKPLRIIKCFLKSKITQIFVSLVEQLTIYGKKYFEWHRISFKDNVDNNKCLESFFSMKENLCLYIQYNTARMTKRNILEWKGKTGMKGKERKFF